MKIKTVCKLDKCAGCTACVDICPQKAIFIEKSMKSYNAVINEQLCIACNACHIVCPNNSQPETSEPLKWYQGWAKDFEVRANGSSGGVATALSKRIIEEKGIVWSCVFERGDFVFRKVEAIDELSKFAGSKYVKSNPTGAYKMIKSELILKKKVLFIGLPCQVASLKNYVGNALIDNLYTVDVICHGTPSIEMLEKYLLQHNYKLSDLIDIRFRKKMHYQMYEKGSAGKYKGIEEEGITDCYLIAFLNGLSYTENCYSCDYAKTARVSDITLGDSWGSNLSNAEKKKGISLILCQSKKGIELIRRAEIHLESVNVENAILRNYQLMHSPEKPKNRGKFLERLEADEEFDKLIAEYFPRQYRKQKIKKWLLSKLRCLAILQ